MNVIDMTIEQVDAEIARRKGWPVIERGFGLPPIMPRASHDWRRAGELLEELVKVGRISVAENGDYVLSWRLPGNVGKRIQFRGMIDLICRAWLAWKVGEEEK